MTTLTIKSACPLLGIKDPSTFHRRKAMGLYDDLEYYTPGKGVKPRITLESIERHIRKHTQKAA